MATHVGIINHGELLFQGSIKDLEAISQPRYALKRIIRLMLPIT